MKLKTIVYSILKYGQEHPVTGVGSVGRVLLVYSGGGGPTQHSSRRIIAADSGVAAAMNYGNTQNIFSLSY